jgi:hypothetical protein
VLGLMVQHKDSIPHWAFDAHPLHALTCKGVEWDWTCDCNDAFKCLCHVCLENNILAALDYRKELCVAGNTSGDGKGVQLYWLKDTTAPDTLDNRVTIAYSSKQWSTAMVK